MKSSQFSLAYGVNIWTHHQSPICRELNDLLGKDNFKMCLFEPIHEERRQLGWATETPDYKWIVGPPSSDSELEEMTQIVCDADVAVLGACPYEVQAARAKTGKLTFIMSERMMRKGFFRLRMLNPRFARGIRRLRSIANQPNVHYLAIGGYAAADVRRIGAFGDRMWTWAYFLDVAPQPPKMRNASRLGILWAGRFLRLKRVDMILRAMAMLRPATDNCTLELIGNGPERDAIKRLTRKLGLASCVFIRDSMAHEAVRQRMAEADIYIFPSNRHEGWGAVANEAMSEGAVLVANDQAGAANVLIDHGRTGFLFHDNDVAGLANTLKTLLADPLLRETVRQAAWQEMQQLWHPRVGAERLLQLCKGLLGRGPKPHYDNGPLRPIPLPQA